MSTQEQLCLEKIHVSNWQIEFKCEYTNVCVIRFTTLTCWIKTTSNVYLENCYGADIIFMHGK